MCIIPELSGYDELQLSSAVGRSRAHLGCSLLPNCRLDAEGTEVDLLFYDIVFFTSLTHDLW